MKNLVALTICLLLFSCNEKKTKVVDADVIIAKAINVSDADKIDNSIIEFDFRDIHYKAEREKGDFLLSRVIVKEKDTLLDMLSKDSFKRFMNDSLIKLPDSMVTKYSASVNSVHYFSVLPYGLDGKAVNKSYLGKVELKGKSYHKIKVTFDEEGGGEDFEDVFIYWVNTETTKIDYLAYSYNEDDGVGLRFREAYNERVVNGIRFVDYNNYKPQDNKAKLDDLDQLFAVNKLSLLSRIELENVSAN